MCLLREDNHQNQPSKTTWSLDSPFICHAFSVSYLPCKKKKKNWNFPYSAVQRRPSKSPVAFIHPLSVSIYKGEVKVLCGDVKSKHTSLIFLSLACSYQQKFDLDAYMRPKLCISDKPSSPLGALISALGNVYGERNSSLMIQMNVRNICFLMFVWLTGKRTELFPSIPLASLRWFVVYRSPQRTLSLNYFNSQNISHIVLRGSAIEKLE